jgi:tetratricopeptide (TPR) repeat protein
MYAPLFTAEDWAAARVKLARQAGEVEELARDRAKHLRDEDAARRARIAMICSSLPKELTQLRELSARAADPEEGIAINTSILEQAADDVVALNRLGRAYDATGSIDQARYAFQRALDIDPRNQVAGRRLRQLVKKR